MSPSNSKLSPNRKTTSCIKNENEKSTGNKRKSKNDEFVTDDFYFKRKKSIKHSQVDINNAVLTAPTGCIMTRNKLKKQLASIDNSELVETTVIEDKCSKIDNIRSKSEKVFIIEISSPCPGKQLDTCYKKRRPLLFESDSDPEIDDFQIKNSIKNEVEENISTCISYPDDRFYPAFDKNVDVRTYFNKKLYPINNKSVVQSLNTFEKIKEEPSSLYNRVKTAHDSNQYKRISQNNSKTSKSLKVTDSTTSFQINSEGDEIIIVTESLIRQLKNEPEIPENNSQDFNNSTTIPIEMIDLDSDDSTTISEEIINLSNIVQTFECYNNSSDQSIENHHNSENNITCHLSLDQIEPNQYSHSVIKDEITNKPIDLDSDNSTTISEEIINLSNIVQTFECYNNSSDQSIENHHNSDKNITCHLSLDQIVPIQYSHTVIKDEIKNKPIDLDSNNSTTISEEIINLSNMQTFKCSNNSSEKSIENHHNSEKNITCHLSLDQIEPNQYSHSVIKDEIKNKPFDLDSNNATTILEEIIGLSNMQTFNCNNNSSDQSIENHHNSEKNIICHPSLDQIEPNQYSHTVMNDEIKNKTKYYSRKGRYNCLLKNDNLSSTNDGYSNKNDLNSKCYCKSLRSFNKDVNKIFTSKIKHFAFNINAKKLREKKLREKHLEANILNMLIANEHKNIIQSSKHIPIFNSISINKKYEKCIDFKENHHIKPVSNPILQKKNYFDDHMSFEMCNEFNKINSLNKSISSNPTTKENNSVSLKNPNGESILKSEINNRKLQKKTINPFITKQTSNSLQKSTRIIDSEKETNITILSEPPQYKNLFHTSSKAYQICPMLRHISENSNNEPVNNLFDLPVDDITFSLNNKSSDDDGNRKLIVSHSILPKKKSLDDCMSFEMCNEFYKIKSLNKSIVSKNESLPNHIQNILKEMYVDELFVSTCQHMVDSYNDDDQLKKCIFPNG